MIRTHTVKFCTRCHVIPAYTGFSGMCVDCWSITDLEAVSHE